MKNRSPAMQVLFDSETAAIFKRRQQLLAEAEKNFEHVKAALSHAKSNLAKAEVMCNCPHLSWADGGGGSVMGDRFVDVCTQCGYENHV